MKQKLIDFYLDFLNNYLTIGKFAEANQLTESECLELLTLGQKLHEQQVDNRFKTN
jgi:hypothetical protein